MSSERICLRGCTQRRVHWANCPDYGLPDDADRTCDGCVPKECRDGSLICSSCYGYISRLLGEVPDLLGRLHSLADPLKATPTDNLRTGSRGILEAQPPVPVDLLDAIESIQAVYGFYTSWGSDLTKHANDVEEITYLLEMVITRHPASDGVRLVWSVQDAVDQWGVERRTRGEQPWTEPVDDTEEVVGHFHEWNGRDQLVSRLDAAKAVEISESTMRRMERAGLLVPWRVKDGSVHRVRFVLSEVEVALKAYRAAEVAP